jgi:hypothetical protein
VKIHDCILRKKHKSNLNSQLKNLEVIVRKLTYILFFINHSIYTKILQNCYLVYDLRLGSFGLQCRIVGVKRIRKIGGLKFRMKQQSLQMLSEGVTHYRKVNVPKTATSRCLPKCQAEAA